MTTEEKLDQIAEKIKNATSLHNLANALVEWETAIAADENCDTAFQLDSESEMWDRGIDICMLPTFGPEPKSTVEVWSWDKDSVLVGWSSQGYEIINRPEADVKSA